LKAVRARLVAFVLFLRGNAETAQDRRIVSLRFMQPADPETRHIRRDRNIRGASPFRQRDAGPHPNVARTFQKQTRGRGHPRLAGDRSVHAITKNMEFKKPNVRRYVYSGNATKPALVSVIGLFADASASGARPSAARASLMVKIPFDV
jgi:hypothetical protein